MRLRFKIAAILAVLFGAWHLLQYKPEPSNPSILGPNNSGVIVRPDGLTIIDPTHTTPIVLPNYGHGETVVVKPNGKVEAKVKTYGWTFDAGLAYSNRNRLSIVCELGFYRRLGWLTGVNVYPLAPNAWTALSYRLPWKRVNNFSLYGGIDTDAKFVTGVFWRFGNS